MIIPTRSWPTPTPRRKGQPPTQEKQPKRRKGQPQPKGPTPLQEGRANPDPEKGQPLPKRTKGRPHPKKEEPTPTLRRDNRNPKEEGPTPSPRRKGQPQLLAREGPTVTPRKKSNPYPRKATQEKEIPTSTQRADPTPRRKSQPQLQASYTLGSGLAGPWPSHFPFLAGPGFLLFWVGALANPDPKGRPLPEEPTPTLKRAYLHPRERRARRNNFQPLPKGTTPTLRRAYLHPRERRVRRRKGQPQPQGPIPVLFSPTLGFDYHCVIVIKIMIKTTRSWTTPTQRRKGQQRPQEGRANPNFKPPLLLGQAWPSPTGSGPSPSFPFGWALAFPFSPFWLAFPLEAWPTRPEGPTQTGKGRGKTRSENCQHFPKEEGPTSTPRKKGQNPQPEKEKPKRKKTTHMKNREN